MRDGTRKRILDDAEGYRRTAVLMTSIDLGVFASIAEAPYTEEALAKKIGASRRGIRILLDALVGMKLLAKENDKYRLTNSSKHTLVPDRPSYMGDMIQLIAHPMMWTAMAGLKTSVLSGEPVIDGSSYGGVFFEELANLSDSISRPAARTLYEIARSMGLKQGAKVLDVACGSGIYGLTCIEHDESSLLVCCDNERVLEIAKHYASEMRLIDRTSFLPGDAFDIDLGDGYDLIVVSFFFHHFDNKKCKTLARKLKRSLRNGGFLAIHDYIPDDRRQKRQTPLLFAPVLLASTPTGELYSYAEFKEMLQKSGFSKFTIRHLQPPSESSVVIAM